MTESPKHRFKRTKYLVATKLQLRYVGIILILMLVTALICSYVIYYTIMVLMGEKLSNVYPQGRLVAIINTVNFRIVLSLLLITPIVTAIGIFLSHKIAGPIYRIEKFLGEMSSGNLSSRIVLRKGDELLSVADKINILNGSLKSTMISQKSGMDRLITEAGVLKKVLGSKPSDLQVLDSSIDRLVNEIKDMQAELVKYKI